MSQLTDPYARHPELAQIPARTPVDRVAVAQPHSTGIAGLARQLPSCRLPLLPGARRRADDLCEFSAALRVASHNRATAVVLDDLGFLGHAQRSSRKSTWRRITGSYLRSTRRSGSLRRFLRVMYV